MSEWTAEKLDALCDGKPHDVPMCPVHTLATVGIITRDEYDEHHRRQLRRSATMMRKATDAIEALAEQWPPKGK